MTDTKLAGLAWSRCMFWHTSQSDLGSWPLRGEADASLIRWLKNPTVRGPDPACLFLSYPCVCERAKQWCTSASAAVPMGFPSNRGSRLSAENAACPCAWDPPKVTDVEFVLSTDLPICFASSSLEVGTHCIHQTQHFWSTDYVLALCCGKLCIQWWIKQTWGKSVNRALMLTQASSKGWLQFSDSSAYSHLFLPTWVETGLSSKYTTGIFS